MNEDQFERGIKRAFGVSARQYHVIRLAFLGSLFLTLLLLGVVALGLLLQVTF